MTRPTTFLAFVLLLGACIAQPSPTTLTDAGPTTTPPSTTVGTPATLSATSETAITAEVLYASLGVDIDLDAVAELGESGDVRYAWLLSDLLRFFGPGTIADSVIGAFEELTGIVLPRRTSPWVESANYLIAEDVPAPPNYRRLKGRLHALVDPRWDPFFSDPNSALDYRLVGYGGVGPDDRPLGSAFGCSTGCIPSLDTPAVTDAAGGSWLADDRIVFGVVVDGDARAYPKHMMEVHEMVNDTLGGTRIGMPYCTLCGSAQAYDLDSVPEGFDPPVLRTSGLLVRSNKLMFDLNTWSAIDTFTGRAVTGPLHDAGVTLEMITVVTSTWGAWREAHPDTTILARDGGIGRTYPDDPLRGRDDNGPIFPVGDVDPRLPVQEQVLGVSLGETVVAFPARAAAGELQSGRAVEMAGVELYLDGDGLRARGTDGIDIPSHQAFWFAWSQFHPETLLWEPGLLEN